MNIVMALDRSRHARAAIQLLQQMRWPAGGLHTPVTEPENTEIL